MRLGKSVFNAFGVVALFALLQAPHAKAARVEKDVFLCGKTTFYKRFGVDAPGIVGFRDTNGNDSVEDEQKKTFYRLKSVQNIERYLSTKPSPKITQAARADFEALTQIEGVYLCVRGNLIESVYQGKPIYTINPTAFSVDPEQNALTVSSLSGVYSGQKDNLVWKLDDQQSINEYLILFGPHSCPSLSSTEYRIHQNSLSQIAISTASQCGNLNWVTQLEFTRVGKDRITLKLELFRTSDLKDGANATPFFEREFEKTL